MLQRPWARQEESLEPEESFFYDDRARGMSPDLVVQGAVRRPGDASSHGGDLSSHAGDGYEPDFEQVSFIGNKFTDSDQGTHIC